MRSTQNITVSNVLETGEQIPLPKNPLSLFIIRTFNKFNEKVSPKVYLISKNRPKYFGTFLEFSGSRINTHHKYVLCFVINMK